MMGFVILAPSSGPNRQLPIDCASDRNTVSTSASTCAGPPGTRAASVRQSAPYEAVENCAIAPSLSPDWYSASILANGLGPSGLKTGGSMITSDCTTPGLSSASCNV